MSWTNWKGHADKDFGGSCHVSLLVLWLYLGPKHEGRSEEEMWEGCVTSWFSPHTHCPRRGLPFLDLPSSWGRVDRGKPGLAP